MVLQVVLGLQVELVLLVLLVIVVIVGYQDLVVLVG